MGFEGSENLLKLLVGEKLATFHLVQAREDPCVIKDELPHGNKGADDLNADVYGAGAAQHSAERRDALLGKGVGQVAAQLLFGRYRILRDHRGHLIGGELKHEVRRETGDIAFHLFTKADRLDFKELGQVAIKQNLNAAQCEDTSGHGLRGELDCEGGARSFGHGGRSGAAWLRGRIKVKEGCGMFPAIAVG